MHTISHRLATVWRDLGLSGRGFAAAVSATGYDVSDVTVLGYEKEEDGTKKVRGDHLAAVCRAFGVTEAWLLTGREPMYPVPGAVKERGFDILAGVVSAISDAAEQGGEAAGLVLRQRLVEEVTALERAARTQEQG